MNKPTPFPPQAEPELLVDMSRMSGLSDAVFAVAMTLLVLDIRLPENTGSAGVYFKLLELAPKVLIYLISFLVIGGAWGAHQRMLGQIRRGDGLLVWFNLLILLFVTLQPASASLLGRFQADRFAIACFALDVVLIQLASLWMWRHAGRNGLINPALDLRVVESLGRRLSFSAGIFLLSIPLMFWNIAAVYTVWVGTFLLVFTTDWLSWQQAARTQPASISLDGARRAQVHVVHGAGRLNFSSGAADGLLVEGIFGGGLTRKVDREGDLVTAGLQVGRGQGLLSMKFPWAWSLSNSLDWTCRFTDRTPLELDFETAGGEAHLDLSDLQITSLRMQTSASSTTIDAPLHAGRTGFQIEASTGSLLIRVPAGVAARIRTAKAFATIEVDLARFPAVENGKEYRSGDYEMAANRLDIQLDVAIGSVKIV